MSLALAILAIWLGSCLILGTSLVLIAWQGTRASRKRVREAGAQLILEAEQFLRETAS